MEIKSEQYIIKTSTNFKIVKEKIDTLFKENNTIFRGKFVGSLKKDAFQGTTNYSTHITVKGKIYATNNETFINIKIVDSRPNNTTITNTFLIVFLVISLLIIGANKSTDIIIYLIPIIIFGLTFLILKAKRFILNIPKSNLKDSADLIAKEVKGIVIENKN